ncbi:glycosyltransferase [Hymenobacter rigui]|uniref:Glycosyltransferase n=1 Tax=Hymenobacter rigui TaxID=334424 RepID=A0A3R9NW54_9BACT|nr:glycosyltransferase [Hymenobacter rigui]RSK43106.1 glycosyltransferase [Hymenobacter rigui]
MSHIIAVHLLNDRSGSPLVLRQALAALHQAGHHLELLTATPGPVGHLSHLPGVRIHALPYRWSASAWRTLLRFGWVQLVIFWKVLWLARSGSVVYVNSLLPFAAALAGWCRGARVVYHVHEVSIRPALLKRLLCAVVNRTAHEVVFVSEYVRETLKLRVRRQRVIYNALSPAFVRQAAQAAPAAAPFTVLMACSLKDYKGVPEFYALAAALPDMRFELVLNADAPTVQAYRLTHPAPANLALFSTTGNMHTFYQRAAVVLNLSRPTEWIETFGMTVLEALSYGRPVVVPPVGGVAEVNVVGQTGFALNGRELPRLVQALELLHRNAITYARMAAAARQRAAAFAPEAFARQVQQCFATTESPALSPIVYTTSQAA